MDLGKYAGVVESLQVGSKQERDRIREVLQMWCDKQEYSLRLASFKRGVLTVSGGHVDVALSRMDSYRMVKYFHTHDCVLVKRIKFVVGESPHEN